MKVEVMACLVSSGGKVKNNLFLPSDVTSKVTKDVNECLITDILVNMSHPIYIWVIIMLGRGGGSIQTLYWSMCEPEVSSTVSANVKKKEKYWITSSIMYFYYADCLLVNCNDIYNNIYIAFRSGSDAWRYNALYIVSNLINDDISVCKIAAGSSEIQ